MKCKKCGKEFKGVQVIDGKKRKLHNRKYCLECSPFGSRNRRQLERYDKSNLCLRCGKELKNFRRHYCNSCNCTRLRERRSKRLYSIVGNTCWICGYGGPERIRALDFHHVNPLEKEFLVNNRNIDNAWDRVIREAKKCVLVCANCHREIEIGLVKQEFVQEVYDKMWRDTPIG